MHHKRKRSKVQRAGCLLCYPHKGRGRNGLEAQRMQEKRAREADRLRAKGLAE
jgi:hypothetical protein